MLGAKPRVSPSPLLLGMPRGPWRSSRECRVIDAALMGQLCHRSQLRKQGGKEVAGGAQPGQRRVAESKPVGFGER